MYDEREALVLLASRVAEDVCDRVKGWQRSACVHAVYRALAHGDTSKLRGLPPEVRERVREALRLLLG